MLVPAALTITRRHWKLRRGQPEQGRLLQARGLFLEKENLIRMPLRNSRGINMMIHHFCIREMKHIE